MGSMDLGSDLDELLRLKLASYDTGCNLQNDLTE